MTWKQTLRAFNYAVLASLCLLQVPTARAALLNLANVPLFMDEKVDPNIFFVIDDSGSMDWEVMTTDAPTGGLFTGTQPDGTNPAGSGSVKHRDSDDNGVADCGFGSGTFFGYTYIVEFGSVTYTDDGLDCNTADEQAWRMRNNDFNPLYFDPMRTYKPWAGTDELGQVFQDMPVTAAKDDPYRTASETIDLLVHNTNFLGGAVPRDTSDRDLDTQPDGFFFYTWNDTNGNGLFDNGEQTEHQLNNLVSDPRLNVWVPNPMLSPAQKAARVQQNFANWFSYYRKREYVAKAAYGEVIANATGARMGLATLHNHNTVNKSIKPMNNSPTTGDKKALLDSLYKMNSANGTPLRSALHNAGKYLDCASSPWFADCPRLALSDGGACQQNFVVLMTDGFYNGSLSSFGNHDGDDSSSFDGGAYADDFSDTLADIAMDYYERDIHTDYPDNLPTVAGIDNAKHQHVVTYSVSFGLNGNLTDNPDDEEAAFAWPDPATSDKAKIDDLRHASYNGRGEFLSAANPQSLIDALNAAIDSITQRTSSAASVALNSGSHNANSRVYQARFQTTDWSGQLLSFKLKASGEIDSQEWDAGAELLNQDYDTGRTILTLNDVNQTGIPFRWNSLPAGMQDLLNLDSADVDDGQGEKRLNYLRGNRADEGTLFRTRLLSVLGDIINSNPFFVGSPPFNPFLVGTPLEQSYEDFRTSAAIANRPAMMYVGANDGMLHGFRASDAEELLAYVPSTVFGELTHLTDQNYTHRYYVDGSPTIGEAYSAFGAACGGNPKCWRTALVGSLGNGGQGYFALDVTNPTAFAEGNASNLVLWEFSDANDADLGYSFSQAAIVQLANDKFAAVVGNGYNNSEPDAHTSTTGHAVLYLLYLDGGLNGSWSAGSDFIKIDTGVGSVATPNGLTAPATVDIDGDYVIDFIYAGDLLGNLWRFDVRDPDPTTWQNPAILFTAKTKIGNSLSQSLPGRKQAVIRRTRTACWCISARGNIWKQAMILRTFPRKRSTVCGTNMTIPLSQSLVTSC